MNKLYLIVANIVLSFTNIPYTYDEISNHSVEKGLNDIIIEDNKDDNCGEQTYLEENVLLSEQVYNNCKDLVDFCGPGHEYGYTSTYTADGCRNWALYMDYGTSDIPYWINMSSMDTVSNTTHKNVLINDIRYQANLWNKAYSHETNQYIVNLYEVGINEETLPDDINGKKVVEIKKENTGHAGVTDPNDLIIKISYVNNDNVSRLGRNVDTPLHEFGHLLGLADLDVDKDNLKVPSGTHKVLMGYSRNTTIENIDNAITYHDIQGIAVQNKKHTNHKFYRYYINGSSYYHVCFYCDIIESKSFVEENSQEFIEADYCGVHDYEQLYSLGNKHWIKCTKCYKVIEHEHEYSYQSIDSTKHKITCYCGYSETNSHSNSNHECIYCGAYLSQHDYKSPYLYVNTRQHKATCSCGATINQAHAVKSGTNVCILCGGKASGGIIQNSLINESYFTDDDILVLSLPDYNRYLNEIIDLNEMLSSKSIQV